MTTVKIVSGKKGFHLKVDGLYISQAFGGDIKAIKNETGIPYGVTEWISVKAIRDFWNKYRIIVIDSLNRPYRSIWGKLDFIPLNQ